MNLNIANVIDDMLIQALMVINTVADVRSLGSDFMNSSSGDDTATQEDSNKIGPQTDVDVYMIPVQSTVE